MNNLSEIMCLIQTGVCADASDLFELLGPILIFGIYIIASIVKAAAQKGKSDESGEENESELKKAVRRRYQEIYQRQTGKTASERTGHQKPPQYVPSTAAPQVDSRTAYNAKWQRQQEKKRQRDTRIQERQRRASQQRRQNELKRDAATVKRPVAGLTEQVVIKPSRKHAPKTAMTSGPKISPKTGNILADMISDPKNLQTAFVLKEILDKPVALRDDF